VLDAKLKLTNYAVSERKGRVTVTNSESALALLRSPALNLTDDVISRSVDINFSALMSEVSSAYSPQMQTKVLNTLQSSGFLVESEPTTFLRRKSSGSKTKP
jgi:hypothetical protein